MKISIITAVYNRDRWIAHAVGSVQGQTYTDVQHVVIDGASTDGTRNILEQIRTPETILVSEPDEGIYDALNKGLRIATGDAVGVMHSDDFYADRNVLADVAQAFEDSGADAVYGDLEYVSADNTSRVIRHWNAGEYSRSKLSRGWMPPHPTLFIRRGIVERLGGYDTSYRVAADYDAMLRYFVKGDMSATYIPRVLVKMRVGGESNRSLRKILQKSREDYLALRKNGVGGLATLAGKNLGKIPQFWMR